MRVIETKKGYLFVRECDRRFSKKNKKTYNIADGLYATFGRTASGKNKLCSMSFSKACFVLEEAEAFWAEMDIRLLERKTSWNKKLPELSFVIDVGGGNVITGNYKNLPKWKTLKNQIEEKYTRW